MAAKAFPLYKIEMDLFSRVFEKKIYGYKATALIYSHEIDDNNVI